MTVDTCRTSSHDIAGSKRAARSSLSHVRQRRARPCAQWRRGLEPATFVRSRSRPGHLANDGGLAIDILDVMQGGRLAPIRIETEYSCMFKWIPSLHDAGQTLKN
jgi:hypothetical protein